MIVEIVVEIDLVERVVFVDILCLDNTSIHVQFYLVDEECFVSAVVLEKLAVEYINIISLLYKLILVSNLLFSLR